MNSALRPKSILNSNPPNQGDLLYFPCFDPLEGIKIAEAGVIRTNVEMTANESLRVYPGLRDCVELYTIHDLRASLCSGVGIILNSKDLKTFLPHYNNSMVRTYHMGAIDLKESLYGFYAIQGNNSDLEISHPEMFYNKFIEYLEIRSNIVFNKNFDFTGTTEELNRHVVNSTLEYCGVTNIHEFLDLMVTRYISCNL